MYNRILSGSKIALFILISLLTVSNAGFMLGTAMAGKPTPPEPPPCAGNPIEVLNENLCGKSITILVNDSTAVCNILCTWDRPTKKKDRWACPVDPITWIGGIVIEDAGAEHGFRFDANTIIVAEITAEGMQTNICQISDNPDFYDGGLWYIPANFVSVN